MQSIMTDKLPFNLSITGASGDSSSLVPIKSRIWQVSTVTTIRFPSNPSSAKSLRSIFLSEWLAAKEAKYSCGVSGVLGE